VPFTEDLAPFFDSDEFGSTVTHGATTFVGIFDNGFSEVLGAASSHPTLTCKTSDAPAVGETITIAGTDYTIMVHEPDGVGVTVLELEEA